LLQLYRQFYVVEQFFVYHLKGLNCPTLSVSLGFPLFASVALWCICVITIFHIV